MAGQWKKRGDPSALGWEGRGADCGVSGAHRFAETVGEDSSSNGL